MQSPFTANVPGEARDAHPVRVLHCIPTLSVGGAETQLRLLAPRLAARGLEVAIFGRFPERDARQLEQQGVTCLALQTRINHDPAIVSQLMGAIAKFRPEVIQTWLTQMDIVGGAIALMRGIPWVLSERSSPPCYAPNLKNRLRRWLGQRAALVANSAQGIDVWPGHPDAQVIGNGIDLGAVAAVPRDELKATEPFRGRTSVVTVSRLVPEKNLDVLITAVGMARAHIANIRLVIVGDGPERPRLEALVASQHLGDYVAFAGFRAAPIAWIRSANMFASASRFEGHPNAVTEAAAAETPMILSDIATHRSLMGQAALYAPADDAAAFATHFVALAQDAQAHSAFVAAARRVIDGFDIDRAAERYAALYVRLLSDFRNRA